MKKLIMLLLATGISISLLAQNSTDALRYSRIFYGGTARFVGLGGAFGALGADFSVVQTNPAGIGLYRLSEASIGPVFQFNGTKADYYGTEASDNRFMAAMGEMGVVFTVKTNNKSPLKNFNVGFGMNRQNNFNNRIYIKGSNAQSSILTDWADLLNNDPGAPLTPDQVRNNYSFDAGLAYDANLLFLDNGVYTSDVEYGGVVQTKAVLSKGSINEFDMSFGGNINDVVYFGATIGIPYVRYLEQSTYSETSNDNNVQHFQSMNYKQELETYGTGFNFKAGVIVKPAAWVRIGAAVHTPTWFGNMHDNWNSSVESAFYDSTAWNNLVYSPLGTYDYRLTTPFRAIGSLAFLFGGKGLISAEYEYANYGTARFNTRGNEDPGTYDNLNTEIKDTYVAPLNLRVGTEWAIDVLRLRAGVGYYGSPYGSGSTNGKKLTISGGLGYRGKHFFADVAYQWSKMEDDYYLYSHLFTDPARTTTYGSSVSTTIGVRF